MTILVSGATTTVREHRGQEGLGVLFVPAARNDPKKSLWPNCIWAADNGAFTIFDAIAFVNMMDRLKGIKGCRFVTAPDVVGDPIETLRLYTIWEPMIRNHGFPVALVGQDGLQLKDVPWDDIDAFFIGGGTEWKLGRDARTITSYAKARGKWCHMGRVNSRRRVHYAESIGCDSIDGTCFSRWPGIYIPKGLEWVKPLPLFR